jgi:ATP-binding cassette subfamily B protein
MPGSEPQSRKNAGQGADPEPKSAAKPSSTQQDDDVVGKAYDSRLMRRLITYLYPYKWPCIASIVAILLKAAADVLGPYLTIVAVDLYLKPAADRTPQAAAADAAGGVAAHPWLAHWLSPWANGGAWTGITELAGIWLAAMIFSYGLEALQTWLMQWTGQKVMFDMRSQIFRHMQQMHIGFFDRNPVGRLVTRLTTDVDAINEMFTSGVFAIFEDVFVLAAIVFVMLRMKWWLALMAFSVLPLILLATRVFRKYVRESYRRIRAAIARINAYSQEYISGMSLVQLFNRQDRAFRDFSAINRIHMEAFKDNILAYALYYPVVEFLSSFAIALIIWMGGGGVLRGTVMLGTLVGFMQYAQRFFRPIQDLSEKYNILQAAMAASERVFKLRWLGAHRIPRRVVHVSATERRDEGACRRREPGRTAGHDRHRVGDARRILHDRTQPDCGYRRPHRGREDDHHQPDDALLRCAARASAGGRCRCARAGSDPAAPAVRRGPAGSIPV